MNTAKSLPVESLLPFPQSRAHGSVSSLTTALNEAKDDAEEDSQPEDDVSDSGKASKPPKRARACIACRNMKIRCLPVQGQDACLGCSKVNRECVMPGPARKRQKTVHKVAELEKKINALTDALIAKNAANPTPPNDSPASQRLDAQSDITRTSTATEAQEIETMFESHGVKGNAWKSPFQAGVKNTPGKVDMNFCPVGETAQAPDPYVDIIDRGILDMDTAAGMFNHYVTTLSPHFPILSFPSYVKASDVRTARPMLFLAILSVTSAPIRPDLQQDLIAELSRQLSERVMFMGEKSMELVQALLIYTTYYVRSHFAKDLAFNQYIHAAVVMCLDLGMGKRYPHKVDQNEVEEAEVRRTWMACYYFASSVSILLRHPSLVRWSSYLEDSVQAFSRPEAQPGDRWLACLCNLAHIAEEVAIVFDMDDPTSSISFTDTKTQYHLKAFEKQLAQWRKSVPEHVDKRLIEHHHGSINLYIHEIAIHCDHNVDEFRPTAPKHSPQPSGSFVTTAHIDALTVCLDSSQRVLNSYLKLDLENCRSSPNLVIVWNTYALVALIKLHGVLHAPDSTFGSVFTPDLRVDYYLDGVTSKLREVAANQRWPPAEAFIFVTKKLRTWHTHKQAPYLDDLNASQSGQSQRDPGEAVQDSAVEKMMRKLPQTHGLPEHWRQPLTKEGMSPVPDATGAVDSQLFGASQTSDLNAAFNAANYNIDWNDLNFSQDEMNVFDSYMNDSGWMGYLI